MCAGWSGLRGFGLVGAGPLSPLVGARCDSSLVGSGCGAFLVGSGCGSLLVGRGSASTVGRVFGLASETVWADNAGHGASVWLLVTQHGREPRELDGKAMG
jgi:hypothetical protein